MSCKALQALHDVAGAVSAALASRANAQHRLHELRTADNSVNGNVLHQAERDVDETLEHVLSSAKQLAFLVARFSEADCYAVVDEEIQQQDEMDEQEALANPDYHEPDFYGSEEPWDTDDQCSIGIETPSVEETLATPEEVERFRTEAPPHESDHLPADFDNLSEEKQEEAWLNAQSVHDAQKHVESIFNGVNDDYFAMSNVYILQLLEFKRIPGTHKLPEALEDIEYSNDGCAMWMSNSLTGWEVCIYDDCGEYPRVERYHNKFEVRQLKGEQTLHFYNCSTFFRWLRDLKSTERPWWSKIYTDFRWIQSTTSEYGEYRYFKFTTKVWYVGEKWTACINEEQLQAGRVKLELYSKETGLLVQVKQVQLASFVKHARAVTSDE